MLKSIYDYGIKAKIQDAPGFAFKNIKAYISLSANGSLLPLMPLRISSFAPTLAQRRTGVTNATFS